MATTTKLTASNGYYGYNSFANTAANHLYVGAENNSTKYDYRSRITFKPLSSLAAIQSNRIRITKVLLYLHRNDGGPTTITVGCSSSNAWNANLAASKTFKVNAATGWYSVDITSFGSVISDYQANWYIHMRNGTPRLRLSGTSSDYVPYIKVTWEYVAATITSDSDEAVLGNELVLSVTPEVDGETHTLTYSVGDQSGTIATHAGDNITWVPPLDLATEFTDSDIGTVTINMSVYNTSGSLIRTEVYYQTLRVPDSMRPDIIDLGLTIDHSLDGYALAGRTSLIFAPKVNMDACYGSNISQIRATITLGSVVQELIWNNATEIDPGIYVGTSITSALLSTAGVASIYLIATDSRGHVGETTQMVTVLPYTPPLINTFEVERYEPVYDADEEISGYVSSDLGGYVWVNIDARVCEVAPEGVQLNSIMWRIDGVCLTKSSMSANGVGTQSINILKDRNIFPSPINEGESWQYTLTVTDTVGVSTAQYSVILPAHVAMSVSPDKYGLAIGMVANGNRINPRFEVAKEYKSYLYGGAYGEDNRRMDKCEQWEYLNISNNNFAPYNSDYAPRISRVGPIVFLDGMIKNTKALDSSFNFTVAILPEWAKPVTDVHALQQGSGRAVWWQRITTAGAVIVQRYRDENGYIGVPETSQFPLSLSWIAADAFVQPVEGEVIATYADGMVTLTDAGDGMDVSYDSTGNVTIEKYSGVTIAYSEGNVAIEQEE